MHILFGLLSGLVFGIGLVISGMSNPAKVLNFLDVAGTWDPSLAFVMGGGLVVTVIAFNIILKRPHPIFGDKFYLPKSSDIDKRLIIGASLFGAGWGIGGLCPGPAISSLAYASPKIAVFVVAMVTGVIVAKTLFPNKG